MTSPLSRPIRRLVASTHQTSAPLMRTTDGRAVVVIGNCPLFAVTRHSPRVEATITSLPVGAGAMSIPPVSGNAVVLNAVEHLAGSAIRTICVGLRYQIAP